MKLAVITPVGPGHENIVTRAQRSVTAARRFNTGLFSQVVHDVVSDFNGALGRSKARNIGMAEHEDADWYFFLDADDAMCPHALTMCDHDSTATFGAVSLSGKITRENVYPCGWPELASHGAAGTLSMGFFCLGSVAREMKFREDMDAGEDFEFYLRLPQFKKIKDPLVQVGRDVPSAGGPRGYKSLDWVGTCNKIVEEALARDPRKFDLSRDAILAARRYPLALH